MEQNCPEHCELTVVGGNKTLCREPDSGPVSCSEYNYLSMEDCPTGLDDNCKYINNKCVSKSDLFGCGDHKTYSECSNDSYCYVSPENGGFRCKTVPQNDLDSNWEEYSKIKHFLLEKNGISVEPNSNVNESIQSMNSILSNKKNTLNSNIATHELIKNKYKEIRKRTDNLSDNLLYTIN